MAAHVEELLIECSQGVLLLLVDEVANGCLEPWLIAEVKALDLSTAGKSLP